VGELNLYLSRRDAQHGERRSFDSADWLELSGHLQSDEGGIYNAQMVNVGYAAGGLERTRFIWGNLI